MVRRLSILVALFGLCAGSAFAQEVDARAALLSSSKAMGADKLKTIEIAGAGSSSLIGQQYSVEGNWPQFEVANYTRAIDFDAKWSREDYTRRQGNFPTFGRVPMAEQPITAIVSGSHAWDIRDGKPVVLTRPYLDGVAFNELRQLELACLGGDHWVNGLLAFSRLRRLAVLVLGVGLVLLARASSGRLLGVRVHRHEPSIGHGVLRRDDGDRGGIRLHIERSTHPTESYAGPAERYRLLGVRPFAGVERCDCR